MNQDCIVKLAVAICFVASIVFAIAASIWGDKK